MTNYVKIERDFIERTRKIIDQYEELVRPRVGVDHEYEVTLLLNCLLGLLVYPQQIAHQEKWEKWLTQEYVINADPEWGIELQFIECAGYKNGNKTSITIEQLTLRNLIRQMRNAASHARFYVHDDGAQQGQIREIEFKAGDEPGDFHLKMPRENVEKFVRKLADSALENIKPE